MFCSPLLHGNSETLNEHSYWRGNASDIFFWGGGGGSGAPSPAPRQTL